MPLRIGYFPISRDLNHPADRRRLVHWALTRGHIIKPFETVDVDVVVLTGRANFLRCLRATRDNVPIVLDLVDSYVADQESLSDLLRGTAKVLMRQQDGTPKRYSHILERAVIGSSAVICENYEQATLYTSLNPNVFPILDFHVEFPVLPVQKVLRKDPIRILWEGQPYTLKGWSGIVKSLNQHNKENSIIRLVTSGHYFRLFDKYIQVSTRDYAKYIFKDLAHEIIEWSVKELALEAKLANMAIIPVAEENLAQFKAENRLLIMWRLGVPTFVEPNHAHTRIQNLFDFEFVRKPDETWNNLIGRAIQEPEALFDYAVKGQEYVLETHKESQLLEKWDEVFHSVL